MPDINDLKFWRVTDPAVFQVIPRRLFEQIKELDDEMIENFYQFGTEILTVPVVRNGKLCRVPNPIIWIAVLHDVAHEMKGFVWAEFNIIEKHIFIQAYSVDKEYQSTNGATEKKVVDYLFSLPVPDEIKTKIKMVTARPKVFEEKHGWKRSNNVLMELDNESNSGSKKPVPDARVVGKTEPEGSKVQQ